MGRNRLVRFLSAIAATGLIAAGACGCAAPGNPAGGSAVQGSAAQDSAVQGNTVHARFFNTSFVLDEGQIVYKLDKRALVPFGEYVPGGFRWFVDMIGVPMSDLTPGDAVQPMLSLGGADAGILICYENLYGGVMRSFWQSRSPDFLIVTANLGWFGRSVLGQHLTMSRMRAMESARPLVSVSNTGMSAVVNSRGEVVHMLRADGEDSATLPLLGASGTRRLRPSPEPYSTQGSRQKSGSGTEPSSSWPCRPVSISDF